MTFPCFDYILDFRTATAAGNKSNRVILGTISQFTYLSESSAGPLIYLLTLFFILNAIEALVIEV